MDFSYDCFVSSRDLLSMLVEQIHIIIAAIMFFFFGNWLLTIFLLYPVGRVEGSGWCEMFTAVWILYAVTDSLPCLTLRTNC